MEKVMENPEALKKQLADLTAKTENQAQYVTDLDLAMQVLQESFAEVRRSYGSVLDNKTTEIFSGIRYKTENRKVTTPISSAANQIFT